MRLFHSSWVAIACFAAAIAANTEKSTEEQAPQDSGTALTGTEWKELEHYLHGQRPGMYGGGGYYGKCVRTFVPWF